MVASTPSWLITTTVPPICQSPLASSFSLWLFSAALELLKKACALSIW
ncbi:unnamed protein product [Callosobruchus maculatus]|uniref:Uncharacterized protein n=1 Tax=Callosobruchus maculatus TaxID=64391 RepID=A0A653DTG7_CALMS|nr:unnamed protein product [Callosobruchus maculatus]